MKKTLSLVLALTLLCALCLSGCGKSETIVIGIPNDTTNEARALQLLQDMADSGHYPIRLIGKDEE